MAIFHFYKLLRLYDSFHTVLLAFFPLTNQQIDRVNALTLLKLIIQHFL